MNPDGPHKPQLKIFGGFRLIDSAGASVAISSRKDKFVLARLAANAGKPVSRDRLCGLLWADRGDEQARASLRQSLSNLRSSLGQADLIFSQQDSLGLNLSQIDVDVAQFETPGTDEANAAELLVLYRGPLLDGLEAPTEESRDWLSTTRQRLEDRAEHLLDLASQSPTSAEEVILVAKTLVQHSPLREPIYRALMKMHAGLGDRNKALAIYRDCMETLKRDLNATPELATEQLYRDILMETGKKPESSVNPSGDLRPFLAVMPFTNLTGDPAFGVVCEGLAEDLVTGLGRFRLFDVVDRNSSAAVARRTEDSHEIGKILGAAYVVQGSLKRLMDSVRITVRLVNAANRAQVWAEQFECPAEELPGLPAMISRAIVIKLQSRVEIFLMEQLQRKTSLAAYDCVIRGIKHLRGYGPDDNRLAVQWFDKALEQDPNYPLARAYRAFADVVIENYGDAPLDVLLAAKASVKQALMHESDDSRIHWLLGLVCGCLADFQGEAQAYARALELNPNDANTLASYGLAMSAAGRFDEGIGYIREAMRLNPYHPEYYWVDLGCAFFSAQRYEDAIEAFSRRSFPKPYVLGRLAACYALLGRAEEAAKTVVEILQQQPDFKISNYRMAAWDEDTKKLLKEGMTKAGLPA